MKRFTRLYLSLDDTTRTGAKIEALERRLKAFQEHQAQRGDEAVQPDLFLEPGEEDDEL